MMAHIGKILLAHDAIKRRRESERKLEDEP